MSLSFELDVALAGTTACSAFAVDWIHPLAASETNTAPRNDKTFRLIPSSMQRMSASVKKRGPMEQSSRTASGTNQRCSFNVSQ
jgi:hypothetical protein